MSQMYLLTIGTSTPPSTYSQDDFVSRFSGINRVAKRMADRIGVDQRHLVLKKTGDEHFCFENQAELAIKQRVNTVSLGSSAARKALALAGIAAEEVGFFYCVTSTGLMVPALSSLLMCDLRLQNRCYRADVVGMGCNAGISGLRLMHSSMTATVKSFGMLVCAEVNSAIYDTDDCFDVGLINCLFGDGAAAVLLQCDQTGVGLRIQDFESYTNYDRLDAMRFDWNEATNRWSFRTTRDIAQVVAQAVREPVARLLERNEMSVADVEHWVVHGGGASIIKAVKKSIGLSDDQLRYTTSVLRDYGNLSSASVFFSLERLKQSSTITQGDRLIMIAMGPGATIEVALLMG